MPTTAAEAYKRLEPPSQTSSLTWLKECYRPCQEAGHDTPHVRLTCQRVCHGASEWCGHRKTPVHSTQEGHNHGTVAALHTTADNNKEQHLVRC